MESQTNTSKDIYEILNLLPHRYPFLLIDRVLEVDVDHVKAIKNVTANEPHFTGHFPDNPVMPGVLIVEAMAQATALVAHARIEANMLEGDENKIFFLVGIDKVRVKRPVIPGDQLVITAELIKQKSSIFFCKAEVRVDGQLVASADLMAAYRDKAL
ncbi:3-hydroxyacyl-ACP dehydratase FabZ [Thiotrichales bacterium 19S3-7]|nr:3-hydroxyacyl-ACP dehydratase FabZ [Thiotrichales bacterium 19S3-7]MCF6802404.1 3-hydroxyacyl-ACP dehydratase FabZ [Thiotrichales bacterium 19S3-11]